jgi:hypothetical protein
LGAFSFSASRTNDFSLFLKDSAGSGEFVSRASVNNQPRTIGNTHAMSTDIPQTNPITNPGTETKSVDAENDKGGDMSDVWIALGVSLLCMGCIIWVVFHYHDGLHRALLLLSGVFGGALGWVIGIMASPYDPKEQGAFAEIAKLSYGFLTGYVVSKVDPVLRALLPPERISEDAKLFFVLASVAATMSLVAFAPTYVSRTYWGPPAHPRENVKKAAHESPAERLS